MDTTVSTIPIKFVKQSCFVNAKVCLIFTWHLLSLETGKGSKIILYWY